MKCGMQLLNGLLVISIASATAQAQGDRDRIVRAKHATALLFEKSGKKAATAVCIDESGVFVTATAAVAGIGRGGEVELLLNPNEDNEVKIAASVVQLFAERGFAVIKAEKSRKYQFLQLGDDATLLETMVVTAFGYAVDATVFAPGSTTPNVSGNVCHITSLKKQSGKLQSIQLDSKLPAGCAGGPVIDNQGRIVGMIGGQRAEGQDTIVVPVSRMRELITKPEVLVQLPKSLSDSSEFHVQLVWPLGDVRDLSVVLQLEKSDGSTQTIPGSRRGDGVYAFKTPMIIRRQANRPIGIPATIHFAKAKLECTLSDRTFQIRGKTFRLSSVSRFEFSRTGNANITLRKGKKLNGKIVGLNRVLVNLGAYSIELDFQRAQRIDVKAKSESQLPVAYNVIVKQQDSVVQQFRRDLEFPDEEYGSTASTPQFKAYQGDTQKIKLPDTIHDVIVGRAGQYLLLHLRKSRKLAVYDVNSVKLERYLPLEDDNALIAAGMEHLFIVYPDQSRIERWSLLNFQKNYAGKLSIPGAVLAMSMGHSSHGPMLFHWSATGGRAGYTFFDVETLKPLVLSPFRAQHISSGDNVHIRSSASGDVFGMWCTNRSPQGMETLSLIGTRVTLKYQNDSAGYVVPTVDGTGILTRTRGLHTVDLRRKSHTPIQSERPCFSSTHDRYYITVPVPQVAQANRRPAVGAINLTDSGEPIVPLPPLDEMSRLSAAAWNQNDFTFDKRIHYVLQADQLICIPFSNDQLVIRRVSLADALQKLGQEHLYIKSVPLRRIIPGEIYQYSIKVASSQNGVKFELVTGPDGMTISDTGELLWTVPPSWTEPVTAVVVSVSNASLQHTYQSLKLKLHRR